MKYRNSILTYIFLIYTALNFSCRSLPSQPQNQKVSIINEKDSTGLIKAKIVVLEDPPVLEIGNLKFNEEQFTDLVKVQVEIDSTDETSILENIIEHKRLVLEAVSLGMDSSETFLDEVSTYQKMFLQDMALDPKDVQFLAEEAYGFYKRELDLSHLFIPCSVYAKAEDTLIIYKQMLIWKNESIDKARFEEICKTFSKDKKTALKGGHLGWIGLFNLIYPLEKKAFNLKVGQISEPIRTKAGYHLLRLNAERPNSGTISIKHILKHTKETDPEIYINKQIAFLDSIKTFIKTDEDFNMAALRFSDDFETRKNGGILPRFGIGTREESEFENIAFQLKDNEISKAFKSSIGVHLIKKIGSYPILNKDDFFKAYENKWTTDSRAEYLKEVRLRKAKEKLNFKLSEEIYQACIDYADDRLKTKDWSIKKTDIDNFVLFSVANKKISAKNFFEFVILQQRLEKWKPEDKAEDILKALFAKYVKQVVLEVEEQEIYKSNKEVLFFFERQKENLLLAQLKEQVIINKSMADTAALRKFYSSHLNLFETKEQAIVTSFKFKNQDVYQRFLNMRDKGKPFALYRGIKPLYFSVNSDLIKPEDKRTLIYLSELFKKNKGYVLEIAGHADKNENVDISKARIKAVLQLLTQHGMDLTRIIEIDHKASKMANKFDWSKNQRVSFQFFSNFESDLIKSFNERSRGDIKAYIEGLPKKDFLEKYGFEWENKIGLKDPKGEPIEYSVRIEKPVKSIEEVKYELIGHYANSLERNLYKKISEKYPVRFNESQLLGIIKKIKNQ
jgi:peptidyl-prolyl cis-trans isomerase SurA